MASRADKLPKNGPDDADASTAAFPGNYLIRDDDIWLKIARYALYAAIFFSGWAILRVASVNLMLSDLAFLVAFLIFFARGRLKAMPFGWMTQFWLLGLILMLGGLLFSTLIYGDVLRWIIVAGQYLFAFLLIPMLLMGQDTNLTRRLPIVYMAGIVLSETIGIVSSFFLTYNDVVDVLGSGFITGNGRLGAMTGEPNPNGAVIAFALSMLVYGVRTGRVRALLAILLAVPLVWGLLASGSFTGFVASIVAVSIVAAASGFRLLFRAGLVAVVAGGLFVASGASLPEVFQERVVRAVSSGDLNQAGTYVGRSALIRDAWENAEDTILVGVGVDRFRVVSHYGAPVHELHLLIWNEGGMVAFLGLLILLISLVVLALLALSKNREEGGMLLAVLAVFMVYTFSIPHMYSRQWIMPVMLALSTVYASRPVMRIRPELWQPSR
jgi:hypothetical protein